MSSCFICALASCGAAVPAGRPDVPEVRSPVPAAACRQPTHCTGRGGPWVEDDHEERGEEANEESDGRGKRQSGVPFVGWAKGMIASGPLPCVIADTPRSTRAPDPLRLPFLPACLLVAASLSLTSHDRTHNTCIH